MRLPSPPGYGEVITLDRQAHAGLGLVTASDHRWTAALTAAAIGLVEFSRAALDYPLAFVRRGERYDAVAILGLRAGENLFVDESGHWRPGAYVPAGIRLHPFCLAEVAGNSGAVPRTLVAIQADQLTAAAPPLFDASGQPTAHWAPWQKLLDAAEQSRRATQDWSEALVAHDLLVPFDALARPRAGEPMRVSGLHRIDESRLNRLPPETLHDWQTRHWLRAAHAHLISLENFARLMDAASTGTAQA